MPKDESEYFFIATIDEMFKGSLPAILNKDPLRSCLFHRDLGLFDFGSIIGELDSTLDSTPDIESSS